MKICLIGPMGSGKSTIGNRLAQRLGIRFEDSDKEIERRTGVDIPYIFEAEGEGGFRKREICAIKDLVESPEKMVLATGGGAVIKKENRQNLTKNCTVIYLLTSVEQQMERTRKDKNRPLLQTADPMQKLLDLFEQRSPLYEEIADIIVSTDNVGIEAILDEIESRLNII
ncbi:MAG: shikimate kinase AroK [Gammaproteobacteria bacterium]|nr:MAG: shikimate kinase AroK [Gammaproteobacteria bacterium]